MYCPLGEGDLFCILLLTTLLLTVLASTIVGPAAAPAPLFEDDAEMERVWGEEHSLEEFVKSDNFKTYDALKSRLDVVLGNVQTAAMSAPTTIDQDVLPFDGGTPIPESSTSEDENLDYFKKLAEA